MQWTVETLNHLVDAEIEALPPLLNARLIRLMEMVELGQVRRIVIAHRDRLVRFGYGYFEAFCQRHHTELVVIDGETLSPEQELVQDLVAILTVFSARLHGLRSYRKVIKDAALQKDQAHRDGS